MLPVFRAGRWRSSREARIDDGNGARANRASPSNAVRPKHRPSAVAGAGGRAEKPASTSPQWAGSPRSPWARRRRHPGADQARRAPQGVSGWARVALRHQPARRARFPARERAQGGLVGWCPVSTVRRHHAGDPVAGGSLAVAGLVAGGGEAGRAGRTHEIVALSRGLAAPGGAAAGAAGVLRLVSISGCARSLPWAFPGGGVGASTRGGLLSTVWGPVGVGSGPRERGPQVWFTSGADVPGPAAPRYRFGWTLGAAESPARGRAGALAPARRPPVPQQLRHPGSAEPGRHGTRRQGGGESGRGAEPVLWRRTQSACASRGPQVPLAAPA